MNSVDISYLSLFLALSLVMVAVAISSRKKLGLTREIITSVLRTVVQLTVVGYLLYYIFDVDNAFLTLAMVLIIVYNASRQADKRNPNQKKRFYQSFLAIFLATGLTLTVLILSGAIQFLPSQIIPITGMIASNSMVAIGLCYREMNSLFRDQRQ